jgi:biopolymer transport protein ExbB/TolQ
MPNDKQEITFLSALMWLKLKWKLVLGFVVTLVASLSFYLRTKDMKKVLQKANDSHDEENNANDEARKKLADGLEKIKDETIEELNKAHNSADKQERQLQKEKKEFVERSKDSETLASDIANKIGADFVEND